jgi:zinc protease
MSRIRPMLVAGLLALLPLAAVAPAAAALELPPMTRAKLKNGLSVIVMPSKRLPLVDLVMVSRAGSAYDPPGKEGLAHLTAALLTQGAGPRDAIRFGEDLAFIGGEIEAEAGAEQFTVRCEVLSKDLDSGLELFRDAIVSPRLEPAEFERQRQRALGTIAAERDDPEAVADKAMMAYVLGDNRLAHPAIGLEGAVGALTRDDVAAFHRELVTPANSVLAVVGDVDPKAVLARLEKAFEAWRGGTAARTPYAPTPRAPGGAVRVVAKPEATQSQIRIACAGVARNHPDYFPILVANTILGGGFTSRLMNAIRIEQGLTYSIDSRFQMYRAGGVYRVRTFTRNETLRRCVDETMKVVRGLVEQGPTAAELEKARRFLTGQYPLGLQAPDDLAARLLDVDFYGLDPRFIQDYEAKVNAVTMEDVNRALKSYFCTDDVRLLVVTQPDVARQQLEGLGPIEVVENR